MFLKELWDKNMKIPEKAPQSQLLGMPEADIRNLLNFPKSEEILKIFKMANDEYLYWDKFKYLPIPESVSKEAAWIYLRAIIRNSQIRKTPIKDKEDNYFGYWLPDSVLKILHQVDQNAAGQMLIDDPDGTAGEKERYLISSIMEEAIASSQLEGAATTRKKAKEMLKSGRKPTNKAEQMILNNYITIKNIKNLINKPLTKELIIGLQASMTKDTLEDPTASGRFRKQEEEIHVVDSRDGQILFEPPQANEIEERIAALCNYANIIQDEEFTHPVVKAIILHFWLAYVHPFIDGNGRTARAIFYWYMLKNKYWLFEYLSISRILLRAPGQYARAYLYSEIDNWDTTYFLMYNLKAIDLAVKSLHMYLMKQQREIKETRKFIRKYPGLNYRQYDLLYHAVSHPDAIYTIKVQKNINNVTYQTARIDLLELEAKGFLERIKTKGKEFVFVPSRHIYRKLKDLKIG